MIGAVCYWLIGWPLAFGKGNPFCGNLYWASHDMEPVGMALVFFHYTFAVTASTIVSGAVAERCNFYAYIIYSIVFTGIYAFDVFSLFMKPPPPPPPRLDPSKNQLLRKWSPATLSQMLVYMFKLFITQFEHNTYQNEAKYLSYLMISIISFENTSS